MVANSAAVTEKGVVRPITYVCTLWWGYLLCAMFLLYGGVKVILSFLDRNYTELTDPLASLIIGLVVAVFVIAYRDRKNWGWYGMVVMNAAVILLAVLRLSLTGNIVLLILGLLALVGLFSAGTKGYISSQR